MRICILGNDGFSRKPTGRVAGLEIYHFNHNELRNMRLRMVPDSSNCLPVIRHTDAVTGKSFSSRIQTGPAGAVALVELPTFNQFTVEVEVEGTVIFKAELVSVDNPFTLIPGDDWYVRVTGPGCQSLGTELVTPARARETAISSPATEPPALSA